MRGQLVHLHVCTYGADAVRVLISLVEASIACRRVGSRSAAQNFESTAVHWAIEVSHPAAKSIAHVERNTNRDVRIIPGVAKTCKVIMETNPIDFPPKCGLGVVELCVHCHTHSNIACVVTQ